jgi:uncharacterized protein
MTEILWKRIDISGLEAARVAERRLEGTAVLRHERDVCSLSYVIDCDEAWHTRSASVRGWLGSKEIQVEIVAENGMWTLNGEPVPRVSGCIDVDLNFSPSTNLLPIRRLRLDVGEEAMVRAAWLRFPSFALEPLEQHYRRTGERQYHYESGSFSADLNVDEAGLVLEYAGVWVAV